MLYLIKKIMPSWTTDRVRQPKKKPAFTEIQQNIARNVHFDEYVAQKYIRVKDQLQKDILAVQETIKNLLEEKNLIEPINSRGLIRRKKLIAIEIQKYEEKLGFLQSEAPIKEFQEKILPFTEAYERELQVNAMEKMRDGNQADAILPPDDVAPVLPPSGVMKDAMQEVDGTVPDLKIMPNEICDECDDVMVLESRSSTLVCWCGNWRHYLDATSSHMAYGEEVEFTAFAYLRMNHYNERLTYSQAKESTRIELSDIYKVMNHLIDIGVTDVNKITMEMTYLAAKKLKMRHVYKQNTQLWCRITGNPPPRMTPEEEEKLRAMFKAVNHLWVKYKPEERKNFLSYNYCLYKFCEILGLESKKGLYKLLKGDKKLEKQDEIFKKICADKELQWQFIPSKNE